jgi:hypothetical protein
MSLTGSSFQLLTVAAAVVVTAGTLLLWNRLRGPRPVRVAARAGLLVSGYALAAVAVLVWINNDYGGLIATWGDLFDNLHPAKHYGAGHPHHHRRPQLPPGIDLTPGMTLPPGVELPPGMKIPTATPTIRTGRAAHG